jgi:redox-sensing transcriptional repressor
MIAELLPERTVERLSKYRRVLSRELENGMDHIYSHDLAKLLHITPVQVRRDLMLIGHTGTLRKGYDIAKLIKLIGEIIDCSGIQKVAIVGLGQLGMALLNYLQNNKNKLHLTAAFDNNPEKIGHIFQGIPCYDEQQLKEVVEKEKITIGILTVPANKAVEMSHRMTDSGILGIINYTPASLKLDNAFLEEYDVITSLEKVAYFSKPFNLDLYKKLIQSQQ